MFTPPWRTVDWFIWLYLVFRFDNALKFKILKLELRKSSTTVNSIFNPQHCCCPVQQLPAIHTFDNEARAQTTAANRKRVKTFMKQKIANCFQHASSV
jgi:hypothetical protein